MEKTNHSSSRPIGVFDSGIGGLTVANAINTHLPNEQIIYFGDTAHLPYGDKSADTIRYYCLRIVKFLLDKNCKMIVIACNSASSAAANLLLDFFPHQTLFVNVIDPLVDEVVAKRYKSVGIIATKATIHAGVYQSKLQRQQAGLSVKALATPLLAPMIEEGYVHNKVSEVLIKEYLSDSRFDNIDAMLLACTHYPLIKKEIQSFLPSSVKVYDSINATVQCVKNTLEAANLLSDKRIKSHQFFVSDYTPSFEETTRLFYEENISLEQFSLW